MYRLNLKAKVFFLLKLTFIALSKLLVTWRCMCLEKRKKFNTKKNENTERKDQKVSHVVVTVTVLPLDM